MSNLYDNGAFVASALTIVDLDGINYLFHFFFWKSFFFLVFGQNSHIGLSLKNS